MKGEDINAFDELLYCMDQAEKVFVVTSRLAEQEWGVIGADKLTSQFFNRLGISPKRKKNPELQYWFLVPDYETATDFWNKNIEKIGQVFTKAKDILEAKERLVFLERNNYIQVYVVPSFICSFHQTICNPDNTRNVAGFSCDYSNNKMRALHWDLLFTARWKKNVFDCFQWENPKTKKPFMTEADALNFMKENPKYFAGYRCPLILNSRVN